MLSNRIDYVMSHSATGLSAWADPVRSPTEVLRRNFSFGVIDITNVLDLRHHIGLSQIVLESDYPHADSTWPDSGRLADAGLAGLPEEEATAIRWGNAAALFDWPAPVTGGGAGQLSSIRGATTSEESIRASPA